MFDLNNFIGKYVTKRPESMFLQDIENNKDELTRKIEGKTVLVEFEAVYKNASVYLNGELIAQRPYGYSNFYVDLSSGLKIGEENVTKSFHAWYVALCEGEYALADVNVRVDILAACEEALIKTWNFATIYTRQSVSLYSDKIKYITENYNDMYGYGGIRFMTYEYDDYDWVKVSKKLDYTK